MKRILFTIILLGSFPWVISQAQTMAEIHASKGVSCAQCHTETPPSKVVKTKKCQECHGSYADLSERTKNMAPNNVHANHLGDLDCRECHGAHRKQKIACEECHNFKFVNP